MASPFEPEGDTVEQLVAATRDVFASASVVRPPPTPARVGRTVLRQPTVELRGRLLIPPEQAYELIADRFKTLGHLPLLRQHDGDDVIIAVPGEMPKAPNNYGLAIVLFLATVVSVLYVGASAQEVLAPLDLLAGWPYAVSLLGILVAHELGHFVVARRLGVPASPPYFIPFPFSVLGTMGAVVRMAAPPKNRRHLFSVAMAGPIAGLVVAIPVLLIGLSLSTVATAPAGVPVLQEGNSIFYALVKYLVFGRWLPSGEVDVFLHPVAMAGWTGLMVTGLNLIPAGQLDGGHIAYTLLGPRSRWLGSGVVVALLGLSFLWQGWLLWAALALVLGQAYAVPFDDMTPLTKGQCVLAILAFLIFLSLFTPIPLVVK